MKIEQGKLVEFKVTNELYGTGKICGVTTNPQPIIGQTVILEIVSLSFKPTDYPYTHMGVFECQIVKEID